jgi:hypothetical protein
MINCKRCKDPADLELEYHDRKVYLCSSCYHVYNYKSNKVHILKNKVRS